MSLCISRQSSRNACPILYSTRRLAKHGQAKKQNLRCGGAGRSHARAFPTGAHRAHPPAHLGAIPPQRSPRPRDDFRRLCTLWGGDGRRPMYGRRRRPSGGRGILRLLIPAPRGPAVGRLRSLGAADAVHGACVRRFRADAAAVVYARRDNGFTGRVQLRVPARNQRALAGALPLLTGAGGGGMLVLYGSARRCSVFIGPPPPPPPPAWSPSPPLSW